MVPLTAFFTNVCFYFHQLKLDRELAQVTLNRDLHLISNWAHQWLVTFSPPKTESMLVSNKKDRDSIPDIVFQGEVIKTSALTNTLVFLYPLI